MLKWLRDVCEDDSGVTMIEYGLMASLVALAAVTAVTTLGTDLTTLFTNIGNKLGG